MQLYLEDLQVGGRFSTGEYEMTEERIKAFATEFDPQPFHLDDAAAEASIFHGLAASGWHTAAVSMRLLVTSGPPFGNGFIGLGGEITWPRPTRPGDILRVESEILEIRRSRSKPDRGIVSIKHVTRNQRDEDVQILNDEDAGVPAPCPQLICHESGAVIILIWNIGNLDVQD